MLLVDRWRTQRRWKPGALLWFGLSAACWGLAPPIALARLKWISDEGMAMPCFVYSIPLMGLFGFVASVIGGRSTSGWWACRGPWVEWCGMWMAAAWATVGAYVLFLIYKDAFT
jgi:ABC-type proline/glycine betaine transport system permease subunit